MAQKSRKNLIFIIIVAVIVVGWFIAAFFFGPNSERGIAKEVERLQRDSIALQGDFAPHGAYSQIRDIYTEVKKIQDLGNPLRFGNTEVDSTRMFDTPQTAIIARYNIAKCDSVLADVLPLWRSTAALALGRQLKENNPNSIVRFNRDYSDYSGLEIYSIRYLSKDNLEDDANKFNPILGELGFKSILYSASPNNVGIEYSFK